MELERDSKILRVVILTAIAAIVGLAVVGGLYGWYLYKTAGTNVDSGGASSVSPSDPSSMQAILQTLTPKSDKSMLTAEEEAQLRASLSAPSGANAHPVDQATLDSLTPPTK